MRLMLMAVIVLASLSDAQVEQLLGTQVAPGIFRRYDRFTDATTVTLYQQSTYETDGSESNVSVGAMFLCSGDTIVCPPDVMLTIHYSGYMWRYLRADNVYLLRAGKRSTAEIVDHVSDPSPPFSGGKVQERMVATMTPRAFAAMFDSAGVELEIGSTELAIGRESHFFEEMARVVSRLVPDSTYAGKHAR